MNIAGETIVVALVITAAGTKVPVGLRLGDTENTVVVKDLLADLVDRGLRFEHGILAVPDGSKGLRKAAAKVFGAHAVVQRCTPQAQERDRLPARGPPHAALVDVL